MPTQRRFCTPVTAQSVQQTGAAQGSRADTGEADVAQRLTRVRSQRQPADLPEPFDEALPRFLTEFCFGDFYTRSGLTLSQRELLVLCALATLGDTAAQLGPHGRACLQVGNSKTVVVAALVHCFPYIGFPRSVAAVRAVKDLEQPAGEASI